MTSEGTAGDEALESHTMRDRTLIGICLAILLAAACSSDRIHRADLRSWKTVERPTEGIVLDVPAEASSSPEGSASFQLHYRSNGIADATWFIGVGVERKTTVEAAHPTLPSADNPLSSDADYMNWLKWKQAYHAEISVHDDATNGSKEYRRDLRLANGDVVSIHATYRYAPFSEPERAADDAAIRRIINSVRPLDR